MTWKKNSNFPKQIQYSKFPIPIFLCPSSEILTKQPYWNVKALIPYWVHKWMCPVLISTTLTNLKKKKKKEIFRSPLWIANSPSSQTFSNFTFQIRWNEGKMSKHFLPHPNRKLKTTKNTSNTTCFDIEQIFAQEAQRTKRWYLVRSFGFYGIGFPRKKLHEYE